MSAVVVLEVPTEVAGHLVVAVRHHRHWAARNGVAVPSALRELEEFFAARARQGQAGTVLDDVELARDGADVSPLLCTYATAARLLSCSDRTVKRLVAAGALSPVRTAGGTRLRTSDVDAYAAALPPARSTRPEAV